MMMDFQSIALADQARVNDYFYRYGEDSCQHSFVSLYCMQQKYGDQICEKDGFLYIMRAKRSSAREQVCLFPMGEASGLADAVALLREDAHARGAFLRFETLTRTAAQALEHLFPGEFSIEPCRDYAEYLYSYEKLAFLPGPEMASKRHDINTFFRDYGSRCCIERLGPEHIEPVRAFQQRWLADRMREQEDPQLLCEDAAIQRGLNHFEALGLSGVVVFIDGALAGFAYGVPLSERCYDVLIEKGDLRFPDIYRVLNRDLVRLCCADYAMINREEDVGAPGLRKAKLSYKPDRLLEKYIAREVAADE